MKTLRVLTCSLVALTFSAVVHAAPVQYQISATYSTEYYISGDLYDPALYSLGTTISANFFYDAATPATSTNNPNPYSGPYSYYTQAAANFSGNILEDSFQASIADAVVHDYPSEGDDSVAIGAGVVAGGQSIPNSSFQGFTIGGFTLEGASFNIIGSGNMLSSQSLPQSLSNLSENYKMILLSFKNSAGNQRWVLFTDANITPVPLPSSALFFLSGLIGLGAKFF